MTITNQLSCICSTFENKTGESALNAAGIKVGADVFLCCGFYAKGQVNLVSASITGGLACEGGTFENAGGVALNAHSITVGGAVSLRDGFCAKGRVNLLAAKIGGQLACNGGIFENARGIALHAEAVTVGADVYLSNGFRAKGKVSLTAAKIAAGLICSDGKFENADGVAFDANSINVGGSVQLRGDFYARGGVDFGAATIANQFACNGGKFENGRGIALDAHSIKVNGAVLLGGGFCAKGKVNLLAATITGQLACSGGTFENANGVALNANSIKVGEHVQLSDGFNAKGEVNLVAARITGGLSCANGIFKNEKSSALCASEVNVGGSVLLSGGFTAKGGVNFNRAKIGGNLDCQGTIFPDSKGYAIDLTLAEIGAALFMKCSLKGCLILGQAKCKTFTDGKRYWPKRGNLILDGFTYERFHECEVSWKARREWLLLQNMGGGFRPQPWTQAVKVLSEMGHSNDARNLAVAREKARSKCMRRWRRSGRFLLWATVGYGYKPWRPVWWSVAFVLLGWIVFTEAGSLGYMAPSIDKVRVSATDSKLPRNYPQFNGLVYALDAYLPGIGFGQDEAWEPSTLVATPVIRAAPDIFLQSHLPNGGIPTTFFTHGWHRVVYWIERILGWVFVSLFIAGISGLMKKE